MVSNEEKFRVTFFSEVLDVMISEFERRFNQESRQFLTLLGDLSLEAENGREFCTFY